VFFDFLVLEDGKRRAKPTLLQPLVSSIDPMFSRRSGQIPVKIFSDFYFRRKSPWVKELGIQKDFDPGKEG
jgi:hypothetical protein